MRYTFRQLEYFVAAGEAESITLAAGRINISQTSISSAIAHLERELGSPLFTRERAQGLAITPLGRVMLREVKHLISEGEALYRVAAETNARAQGDGACLNAAGTLSVGCSLALAPLMMPELIEGFRRIHPGAQVDCVELPEETIVGELRLGQVQAAITLGMQLPDDMESVALAALPVMVWVGESHPLANRSAIDLELLADADLILHDVPSSREHAMALFHDRGLTPHVQLRSANLEMVRAVVANGGGYTFSAVQPRCDAAPDGRRILRKPLTGRHPAMRLGLASVRSAAKSPLLIAFERHCSAVVSDFYIPGMTAPALDRQRLIEKSSHRGAAPVGPCLGECDAAEAHDREHHQ